jgi:hypothetical protein
MPFSKIFVSAAPQERTCARSLWRTPGRSGERPVDVDYPPRNPFLMVPATVPVMLAVLAMLSSKKPNSQIASILRCAIVGRSRNPMKVLLQSEISASIQPILNLPDRNLVMAPASGSSLPGGAAKFINEVVLPAEAALPAGATCVGRLDQ